MGTWHYYELSLFAAATAKPRLEAWEKFLKEQYPESVFSAWHINKTHWCKVDVNNIEHDVLDAIIRKSFDITAPKRKKRVKNIE